MSKFIQRTEAPTEDNKYYFTDNLYNNAGVGMPNCTAYAWGRFYEITGKKPTIGLVNACDWYKEAKRLGYEVGKEPKLGAIICWDGAGANPYGHIGVVEQIFFDNSVRVSESAWGGVYWNNGLIARPDDNYQHPTSANHYPCLGFIYCGIEFSEDEPEEKFYRVQVGAYSVPANAVNMYDRLKADGEDAIVKFYEEMYHIQVGAYSVKANATKKEKELKKKGYDTIITDKNGKDVPIEELRSEAKPKAKQTEIKVGDSVMINPGATDWDNRLLASFCYERKHTVKSLEGDRAVITYDDVVIAAMNKKDLKKA